MGLKKGGYKEYTATVDLNQYEGFEELKGSFKEDCKTEIKTFLVESILDYVGSGTSPVSGGQFKKSLTPEYKARKLLTSGVGYANLELEGDMLDNLDAQDSRGNKIKVGIIGGGTVEKKKAERHNEGTKGWPVRQFLPYEGGKFKNQIESEVKRIVKDYFNQQKEKK